MVMDYGVLCCLCLEAENHSGKWYNDSSRAVEIPCDWRAQRTETAASCCSVHGIDALLGLLLCLNNTKIYFISRALLQSLWVECLLSYFLMSLLMSKLILIFFIV